MCERRRRWHHSSGPTSVGHRRPRPPSSSAPPQRPAVASGCCTSHRRPATARRAVLRSSARCAWPNALERRCSNGAWRLVQAPPPTVPGHLGSSSWLPSPLPSSLAGSHGRRTPSCRSAATMSGGRCLLYRPGVDGISFTVHPWAPESCSIRKQRLRLSRRRPPPLDCLTGPPWSRDSEVRRRARPGSGRPSCAANRDPAGYVLVWFRPSPVHLSRRESSIRSPWENRQVLQASPRCAMRSGRPAGRLSRGDAQLLIWSCALCCFCVQLAWAKGIHRDSMVAA